MRRAGAERPEAPADILAAARDYHARGYAPIPLPARSKNPGRENWQKERYNAATIPAAFADAGGIGLLCGAPSGGLVDVDLDTDEACAAWGYYAPPTERRHGRASSPGSHWWYKVDTPPDKTLRLRDPAAPDVTLIELRSTGGQTVVPPSLHDESGELLAWDADGEPARVDVAVLACAVRRAAAAALLARRWLKGARHDVALALAGLLLRGRMSQTDVERFVEIVARVARDDQVTDRVQAVRDTVDAIAKGEPTTGGRRLAELLPQGDAVVARVREWLGLATDPADAIIMPRALDLADFLRVEFPPSERIMDPVFPRQGLGMVHSWRGLGKTYFSISFGLAVAAGARFLKWGVTRPWNVLYVDGEMRGVEMQERIAKLLKGITPRPEPSAFRIITPDLQEYGIPDLGTSEGQRWLDAELRDCDLVILDNLSSLVRGSSDKEDEAWLPLLGWLLRLRASGRSVLMVHHDGKNETQRGTSRREDQLDTVFHLTKPKNYRPSEGARFVLHFGKHRGFYGKDTEPFEVALVEDDAGVLAWTWRDIEDAVTIQVADRLNDGFTVTQIAADLNIGRATVDRHKKKAIERGLFNGE